MQTALLNKVILQRLVRWKECQMNEDDTMCFSEGAKEREDHDYTENRIEDK